MDRHTLHEERMILSGLNFGIAQLQSLRLLSLQTTICCYVRTQ